MNNVRSRLSSKASLAIIASILLIAVSLIRVWLRRADLVAEDRFVLYNVICLTGLLVCFTVLSLADDKKQKLVLFMASTYLSLFVVEVYLTVSTPAPYASALDNAISASRQGVAYDQRETAQVLEDLWLEGVDAWPTFYATDWSQTQIFDTKVSAAVSHPDGSVSTQRVDESNLYPMNGISLSKSVYCNEGGAFSIFDLDEHGFPNPTGLYDRQVEIATLGDSFARGACVERHESIAGQLREMGHANTLNLASGGSLLVEYATFVEFVEPVRPKVVLWIYCECNDLTDLDVEMQNELLMKYLREDGFSQKLFDKQQEIDKVLKGYADSAYIEWQRRTLEQPPARRTDSAQAIRDREEERVTLRVNSYTRSVYLPQLRNLIRNLLYGDGTGPEPGSVFEETLAKAKQRMEAWGGTLYFVYIPEWSRYANRKGVTFRHRGKVLAMVEKLGIPIIDFHQEMLRLDDPLEMFPFRANNHYNAEGYRLVASQVKRRLVKERSLQ